MKCPVCGGINSGDCYRCRPPKPKFVAAPIGLGLGLNLATKGQSGCWCTCYNCINRGIHCNNGGTCFGG